MKILTITDFYLIGDRINQVSQLLSEYEIDAIALVGGLFSNSGSDDENKKNRSKKKTKFVKSEANLIRQLNWLLKPVLVVPSPADLTQNSLIKQIQAQDTINIRYINQKSTVLNNWLFLGLSKLKNLEDYFRLKIENLVVLYTGENESPPENKFDFVLLTKHSYNQTNGIFSVKIDSLTANLVTMVDLENRSVTAIPI